MARPAISSVTTIAAFSLALLTHAGLIGGVTYWGWQHNQQQASLPFESKNIVYAEYLEDATALNDNTLLKETPPPVKWVQATAKLDDSQYEPLSQALLPPDNFTIYTDEQEYHIQQELIQQTESIRLANLTPDFPYIEEAPATPKAKTPTNRKAAATKGQGKGQVNKGKTQSARCSVAKASSKSKAKQAALVRIALSPSGSKKTIKLAQSSGSAAFDKAALSSARSAKCRPYIQNGTAKAAIVQISYR
ncbi:MAG: TonB family protein [Alphaproteobacteria bacterium]